MKFVDTLTLTVEAGKGGKGCVSFRREKYVPRGGPDGGNGGKGGDVIIEGDAGIQTLLDLRYKREYKAQSGEPGKSNDMTGKGGSDLILRVPFGTIIFNEETDEMLVDITPENPTYLLARGGRGGRGNTAFTTPTQRAPRECEPGEQGELKSIRMELKLLADVGIVGYPNAGKSTFISVVSAAKPKIADYPFTTLAPVLGVVKNDYGRAYVIADMPGLIEGASEGTGLGLQFLRHIERTTVLLHFVDSSLEESMLDRYNAIRFELENYSETVADKQEIIVSTKIDSAITENLQEFRDFVKGTGKFYFEISSLSKEGVAELMKCLNQTFLQEKPE